MWSYGTILQRFARLLEEGNSLNERISVNKNAFDLGGSRAVLIMIDMQHGFIDSDSSLCIAGAQATVPACARALCSARERGVPVVYALRRYAADGSDVEAPRYHAWLRDRALSDACANPNSVRVPREMEPQPSDRVIYKPRYSAFFGTGLDVLLRRLGVGTVILAGTTTPNCVRSSCYDALSLDYNVVVLEDCTSSRSPEVQRANIDDMVCAGAQVIDSARFAASGLGGLVDYASQVQAAVDGVRA